MAPDFRHRSGRPARAGRTADFAVYNIIQSYVYNIRTIPGKAGWDTPPAGRPRR